MKATIYLVVILFLSFQFVEILPSSAQGGALEIAYISSPPDKICITALDQSQDVCYPTDDQATVRNLAWSPDGRFLSYYRSYIPHSSATPTFSALTGSYLIDVAAGSNQRIDLPLWGGYVAGWSPDSKQLIVIGLSDPDAKRKIYTMNLDGSDLRMLTDGHEEYFVPSWSPDGQSLAYVSGLEIGTLHIMRADGTDDKALKTDQNVSSESPPQWSPDSKQIAITITTGMVAQHDQSEIYLIATDGSGIRRLTNTGGTSTDPRWSPDGAQLTFTGFKVGAFSVPSTDPLLNEVLRINADGTHLTDLTQSEGLDTGGVWSPDGQWVAFHSDRWSDESQAPVSGIFIMRPDGSDVHMIAPPPTGLTQTSSAGSPVWRPIPHP